MYSDQKYLNVYPWKTYQPFEEATESGQVFIHPVFSLTGLLEHWSLHWPQPADKSWETTAHMEENLVVNFRYQKHCANSVFLL